ncbi:MAG: hemerythrin domain-containing protein [Pararhodobacter sp.]
MADRKGKAGIGGLGLETRAALPEALRYLLARYPRDLWQAHGNFDGLTRFWLERHMMFRQVLGEWHAETRQFIDNAGDPRRFAGRSAHLGGFLINQLHGHHQIEDHHYFPELSRAEPRLERGFSILDADHHALDGHLQALANDTNALLRGFAEKTAKARERAGALEARLAGFAPFLDRHLVDEEELVVPVILHHALRF